MDFDIALTRCDQTVLSCFMTDMPCLAKNGCKICANCNDKTRPCEQHHYQHQQQQIQQQPLEF